MVQSDAEGGSGAGPQKKTETRTETKKVSDLPQQDFRALVEKVKLGQR